MLLEMSIACAVGTIVVTTLNSRYRHHHDPQRRGKILGQVLRHANRSKHHFSERESQLEVLLLELTVAAEMLTEALDAEAESGRRALASDGEVAAENSPGGQEPVAALIQWRERRSEVQRSQDAYCRAADAFREFAESLPQPLRAKAAERGRLAMSISHA